MIHNLVIADDLTGAAEMAGITFSYGFSVKIISGKINHNISDEEVIIINTDSRNCDKEEASQIVKDIFKTLPLAEDVFIYKKTDSLLRGNIEQEINSIFSVSSFHSSILIPANPGKTRTIRNSEYLIGNIPIDQTVYRLDPEYPRKKSNVKDLIKDSSDKIVTGKSLKKLKQGEILVPDITSTDDINKIIKKGIPDKTLPAGGADFFTELIKQRHQDKKQDKKEAFSYPDNKCFLIGSYSHISRQDTQTLDKAGYRIFKLPFKENHSFKEFEDWKKDLLDYSKKHNQLIISVPDDYIEGEELQGDLVDYLGGVAADIAEKEKDAFHFLITGGRTASTFCRKMKWEQLSVIHVLDSGVITLKSHKSNHYLTIKPGSYPWPASVLK